MAFIETLAPEQASGEALAMYERQRTHFGYLPNYARLFCHRPEVMARWAALLASIRRPVAPRRFELATLAAAQALNNSYCALAHGRALAELADAATVQAVAEGRETDALDAQERAVVAFARQVAVDAASVEQADIDRLRAVGLADAEIFDLVAVIAARAFFTKMLDGLGAEPDAAYREMAPRLREALSVGRPIAAAPPAVDRR
ncbi:peroxidase [Billgrantia azerbaijanica]|nr:peroxidase [Halomonas azerbaijanica]